MPKPVLKLVDEASVFRDQMEAIEERNKELVEIPLSISVDWAALAAWLVEKEELRQGAVFRAVDLSSDMESGSATRRRAATYIGRLLYSHFHEQMHLAASGQHPFMRRPKPDWSDGDELTLELPF